MNINFVAPCNQLGYGVVAGNMLLAMHRRNWSVAFWPIGNPDWPITEDHSVIRLCIEKQGSYDPNATCVRVWHQFALDQFVGRGPHVGLPIFELDNFTGREVWHMRACDRVLVASQWALDVLRDNGIENGAVVPFGVDGRIFTLTAPTSVGREVPLERDDEETVFFNCGKWEYRKGHDFVIKAFSAAFRPGDKVRLVMNCYNPFLNAGQTDEWHRLYVQSPLGKIGRITILSQRLPTQRHVAALMHKVDCGFFPSRAEGWNMEACEMLACGKHVIATAYSAHTEFLTESNSLPILVRGKEDAFDSIWFHGQGQWAALGKDELDQAVEHLRTIHRAKQEGKLGVNHAGAETARRLTWDNTVNELGKALA